MNRTEKKTTVTEVELTVEGKKVIAALREYLSHENIPEHASFYVKVPGGGDWSNTGLDIEDETFIVRWTKEETS